MPNASLESILKAARALVKLKMDAAAMCMENTKMTVSDSMKDDLDAQQLQASGKPRRPIPTTNEAQTELEFARARAELLNESDVRALDDVLAETNPGVRTFASGAVRSTDADDVRFSLISPIAMRRLAMTCAEGAKKYGDHNWLKGFPQSCLLDHAMNHLNLYQTGDKSEDHLAHAMWNIMAMLHFDETRPDLCDLHKVMG